MYMVDFKKEIYAFKIYQKIDVVKERFSTSFIRLLNRIHRVENAPVGVHQRQWAYDDFDHR